MLELVSFVSSEDASQSRIAREERKAVAEMENEYLQEFSELQRIKQTVSSQYRSVWESCTLNSGLQRPEAQHPTYTDRSCQECIEIQEQAAKDIQEWFRIKTKQAVIEKKKQLRWEAEKRAASALAAAEAEKKRKEEAAAFEEAQGAFLLEEMKQKFRRNM